jgi:hypothetical protein
MFEVVVHYWMHDTTRSITDALGVSEIMAGLAMATVSGIEILAKGGD